MARRAPRGMRAKVPEAYQTCVDDVIARLGSISHPHEVPYAALVDGEATPLRRGTAWVGQARQRLMRQGLSEDEAGNVVAYVAGLHPAAGGWTTLEVARLLALRARAACAQLPS